ncbi:MAG: hypothetical protein ACD_48C00384G0001, partial [uncultured bacterium]
RVRSIPKDRFPEIALDYPIELPDQYAL